MKRCLKIGLTGGIGTGKTTVTTMLKDLGCMIFSADDVAKALQEHDQEIITGIKRLFGDEIYHDGIPNRRQIAQRIFSDDSIRREVNALIHPKVFSAFDEAVKNAERLGVPAIVKEAAILFEAGGDRGLDAVIVLASSEALRLERMMKRGVSQEDALARMRAQLPQDELLKKTPYTLLNNADLESLKEATRLLFLRIMQDFQSKL